MNDPPEISSVELPGLQTNQKSITQLEMKSIVG